MNKQFFWNRRTSKRQYGKHSDASNSIKKPKKLQTWSHTFICLARKDQVICPDSDERMALQIAGLGEKKVTFLLDVQSGEIRDKIHQFPKLKGGGGFEMLRIAEGGGKSLLEISIPKNGYTVPYLRAVVHHAKIYLWPLQKDLDVTDDEESEIIDVNTCIYIMYYNSCKHTIFNLSYTCILHCIQCIHVQ